MSTESYLLQKPNKESKVYHSITPESANWNHLSFEARTMSLGDVWEHNTEENELVIVLLSGNFKVNSTKGSWETINGRKDVFS